MIAYKVVEKVTRISSNFSMAKSYLKKDTLKAFKKDPEIYKFCKTYKDGAVVTAVPKSIGILCFEKLSEAFRFHKHSLGEANSVIIEVSGDDDKKTKIERLICGCGADPRELAASTRHYGNAPYGTIAFPQVTVIGRVSSDKLKQYKG